MTAKKLANRRLQQWNLDWILPQQLDQKGHLSEAAKSVEEMISIPHLSVIFADLYKHSIEGDDKQKKQSRPLQIVT